MPRQKHKEIRLCIDIHQTMPRQGHKETTGIDIHQTIPRQAHEKLRV